MNQNAKKEIFADSILSLIQRENDFIIGYEIYSSNKHGDEAFFLIAFHKNNCTAYKYVFKTFVTNGQSPYYLDSFILARKKKDSILEIIKLTKIWTLRSEDKDGLYCPLEPKFSHCTISDAANEKLIVATKSHQTSSVFYAPQFYENCCPGNIDRQRFLALAKIIDQIFKINYHLA